MRKLLIARALVHRPSILILDEATSTLRGADRIYVIEKGRVVPQCSYDGLVNEKGPFARLVSRQQV